MARVGVDIDGVLYDFTHDMYRRLNKLGIDAGDHNRKDTWRFYEGWGMTGPEFYQHMAQAVEDEDLYTAMPPSVDAVCGMRKLQEDAHSIHLITARPNEKDTTRKLTLKWLAEHSIPFNTLTFSKNKTEVPTDYFLDDHTPNVLALKKSGVKAWLMSAFHNRNDVFPHRIDSVTRFAELVQQEENQKWY